MPSEIDLPCPKLVDVLKAARNHSNDLQDFGKMLSNHEVAIYLAQQPEGSGPERFSLTSSYFARLASN